MKSPENNIVWREIELCRRRKAEDEAALVEEIVGVVGVFAKFYN